MKEWCDKKARVKKFGVGNKVVMFLVQRLSLKARYRGHLDSETKLSDMN